MLTIRRLQDDSFTVRPDARGVECLDPGVVGAVEMQTVDGAQGLFANIHFLKDSQEYSRDALVSWNISLSNILTFKELVAPQSS